jgi:hypothetical protein
VKPLNLEPYRAACIRCGADIFWATSASTGAAMPVNEKPDERAGNLLIYQDGTGLRVGVLSRNQAAGARKTGSTLYRSHYVDCHNTTAGRKGLRR